MADTNLLVLAREYKKLREEVKQVLQLPKGDTGAKGDKGDTGDTGPQGFPGKDGKDGINGYNGIDGLNGKDGQDGKDGLDGVGVQNAYLDFDNALVIVLTDGREINAGYLSQETKEAVMATFKQGASTINELLPSQTGNAGKYLTTDGTNTSWATVAGGGSVTAVTGTSPVVSSGGTTPAISLASGYGDTQNPYASKTANNFLAAPNGSAGVPTFRALAAADVPTLNQNTTGTASNVTGIVAVANGGSGTATPSLVAGTNVTITGSWPNQTIAASGGGGGGGAITISNKTGAYTVVAGDLGTIINCTSGTFTVSLTAAATLGSGFNCWIWNTSATATDAITIDPNSAETIDGRATLILRRGEGMQIVCDGTNFQTGDKKTMRAYAENLLSTGTRPIASGSNSVALMNNSTASSDYALALGFIATVNGAESIATHRSTAGSNYSAAIGENSAQGGAVTASGAGAMALGGSYASGVDSLAAGVANNTSTYGAQGSNSLALGFRATATGTRSTAIGGNTSTASANNSAAIGGADLTASGSFSVALGGQVSTASGEASYAFGVRSVAAEVGKIAWGAFSESTQGASQAGMIVLRTNTTDATASVLRSNGNAAGGTNQLILRNSSAYAFTGIIVARRQASGGTESAAWKVEGLIRREANAASTTLVASTVTAISNVPGWTLALSADTTNGGLAVTATGAAATNIRWVATIQTSEVTFA